MRQLPRLLAVFGAGALVVLLLTRINRPDADPTRQARSIGEATAIEQPPHENAVVPEPKTDVLGPTPSATPLEARAKMGSSGETFSQLAERFESESKDPTWSAATETQIFGKISAINDLAVLSLDVDCRTSMCRIRVVQDNMSSSSMQALVSVIGSPSWLLQNPSDPTLHIVWLPDVPMVIRGTPEALTYLQRDGTGLQATTN